MATHNKRSKEKIAISLSRCLPAASVPPPWPTHETKCDSVVQRDECAQCASHAN